MSRNDEKYKDSMSQYIPLYRKYRPKNLQEVVGQEHIKKALSNAITLNKISHAYLFTGPRGTGKTSVARILAKSLNCQQGPTLTPCEVCPSCLDIKNSNPMDVIEIDAASNRKVEDARDILEKIQYIPVNGKYKIYIIDEVHMLTKEAFNTLLKTLEEPPENVIFILATTEPQKVLETITSRCQRFDFRRITTDDIVNHLKEVSKTEKIKIEDDALFTIAKNSAGGMRDSLALLDQASVLGSEKSINSEDINNLLGRVSFDLLNNLSDSIIQSKPQEAIELLEKIYNSGNEPSQILVNLMGYLKNLLIVKTCQGAELLADLTQLNTSQIDALKKQSENVEVHQITFLIEKIIYYIKELKTTTSQHLWLEVAVIDFANLAQNTKLIELQERLTKLEGGGKYIPAPSSSPAIVMPKETAKPVIEQAPVVGQKAPEHKAGIQKEIKPEPVEQPVSQPQASSTQDMSKLWVELLKSISSPPTVAILSDHAKPVEMSSEKVLIGCESEIFLKLLSDDTKKKAITAAAQSILGKDVKVSIKLASAVSSLEEKKNTTKPASLNKKPEPLKVKEPESEPEEAEEFSEEDDFAMHELAKKNKKEEIPSDQVSMVINLFGGKYIDE